MTGAGVGGVIGWALGSGVRGVIGGVGGEIGLFVGGMYLDPTGAASVYIA